MDLPPSPPALDAMDDDDTFELSTSAARRRHTTAAQLQAIRGRSMRKIASTLESVEPPYVRRARKTFTAFGSRLAETFRSEHTVVNLLFPPDDEDALTQDVCELGKALGAGETAGHGGLLLRLNTKRESLSSAYLHIQMFS